MNSDAVCPLCRKKTVRMVYLGNITEDYFDHPYKISSSDYGIHLDIYKCLTCYIVFEDVASLTKRIEHHYKSLHDTAYEVERSNRARAFKRIIGQLKKIKRAGTLLDIGCATGAFLVEAKKEGYDVAGIEPSAWAANIAQKKFHLPVLTGRVEELDYPKNSFDVVTLLDVIEHLVNPRTVLKKTNTIMKTGGVLCIVTPNIESLAVRVLGEKWWHIRPSHFYYFSPSTMTSLLSDTGFEIITRRTYTWYLSADYLLERLLKLFSIRIKMNAQLLKETTIGINLQDSMEIYAIKK